MLLSLRQACRKKEKQRHRTLVKTAEKLLEPGGCYKQSERKGRVQVSRDSHVQVGRAPSYLPVLQVLYGYKQAPCDIEELPAQAICKQTQDSVHRLWEPR